MRWRGALSAAAAAVLLVCAGQAHSLGLGRMSVQSALGEPLLAEIDITTLSSEQAASLRVSIAPAEVYRAAGMEFAEVLRGARVELSRRADGRAVLRITSERIARDPFVDLILQATWASGRLVREYTVLLDPPRAGQPATDASETGGASDRVSTAAGRAAAGGRALTTSSASPAPSPATLPGSAAVGTAAPAPAGSLSVESAPGALAGVTAPAATGTGAASSGAGMPGSGADPRISTSSLAPDAALTAQAGQVVSTVSPPAAAQQPPEPKSRAAARKTGRAKAEDPPGSRAEKGKGTRHEVSSGQTLYGIAREHRTEGVSLDQMLVALYKANPDAFVGQNMNRLLAGSVLEVPGSQEAASIQVAEARALIDAHTADLAAYRQRLAAGAATADRHLPQQRASGTVRTRVQDRRQSAEQTSDQLKLARGDVKPGAAPETALSRQAEARELAQREAEVQRNVEALRQLRGSASAPTAAEPSRHGGGRAMEDAKVAPGQVPSPGASAPAAMTVGSASSPAVDAASAPASAPPASAPAGASSAAEPARPASAPASDAVAVSRVQPDLLGNLYVVIGGLALVASVGVVTALALLRRRRKSGRPGSAPSVGRATDPGLGLDEAADAVQRPLRSDFADALANVEDPGSAVPVLDEAVQEEAPRGQRPDPMAEAEVYLAYGRVDEAVALLRQAMRDEPDRSDIVFKLLELHASRQETGAFQGVVDVMQRRTGGQGPDWAQVVAMQLALTGQDDATAKAVPVRVQTGGSAVPPVRARQGSNAASGTATSQAAARAEPTAEVPRQEPALGPEPTDLQSSDFALDVDVPSAAGPGLAEALDASAARTTEVAEGSFERKLALAEEFIQIGDVEGARELLDEVGNQAEGPLKERARRLIDALGR